MKLCKVSDTTIVIPMTPEVKWWDSSYLDHDAVVDIQKRYIHLTPREIDGHTVMVAYDRETDTLFIMDEAKR